MTQVATNRRARVWQGVQVALSIAVLAVLISDTDTDALRRIGPRLSVGWLVAASLLKVVTLLLHELRLWVSLNPPRPPVGKVVAIGLASGVLNLVLPGRAGDIAAIAMLVRECGVKTGAAAAAVGVVAFLEAAMFGLTLVAVLMLGAPRWREVVGPDAWFQAVGGASGLTLLGVGIALVAVIFARRTLVTEDEPPPGPSPVQVVRDTLVQASDNLATPATLALNTGLALLQVIGMVGAFALLFPAVGVEVPLPMLAAAGVLALSSLASVLFPPTYGAGPAAASVAVLAAFGLGREDALAYAAGWWVVSQVPAALLGLPALVRRRPRDP